MKRKIISFTTFFVWIFLLQYFFFPDGETLFFVFLSFLNAIFYALTEDYLLRFIVKTVKKVVKTEQEEVK